MGDNLDSRRSTTDFVLTLDGSIVGWICKLQKSIILSTNEAKYMEISKAEKEMIWLKFFLKMLGK